MKKETKVTVHTPMIEKLEKAALTWPERALALEISDQQTYDHAVRLLGAVSELEDKIVEHHKEIKASAYATWKIAVAAEKRLLDPCQKAKAIFKRMIAAWHEEQERVRLEADRQAAEVQAAEEEAHRLELARVAEGLGAPPEAVEEIMTAPSLSPRPVTGPTFNKVAGLVTRVSYRAEVTDIRALCRAIADGVVSPLLVEANQSALNKRASAEKETLNIPGVRVIRDTGITDRR